MPASVEPVPLDEVRATLERLDAIRASAPEGVTVVMERKEPGPKSADDVDRALGEAIRERRKAMGMSHKQLAQACGISYQQVQKYENGENRISFSRLAQISRALSCNVTDLAAAVDGGSEPLVTVEYQRVGSLPDAEQLLRLYEKLSPETRRRLIDFLDAVVASMGPAVAASETGPARVRRAP